MDTLIEARGEENGLTLMRRYGEAFPAGYRERFMPTLAILDIEHVQESLLSGGMAMNLYRPIEAKPLPAIGIAVSLRATVMWGHVSRCGVSVR